ncbi:MAG TPA: hypothetical protein VFF64_04740 [Candidatus Eremiobacteraceae bacterium]|nr:hypothetical protein [Candidatus Eremiobacteraceae bacterium]
MATRIEPSVREDDYDASVAIVEDHLIERLLTARVDLKKIQSAAKMLYLQRFLVTVILRLRLGRPCVCCFLLPQSCSVGFKAKARAA